MVSRANEIISWSRLPTEITEGQYFSNNVLKYHKVFGNFTSTFGKHAHNNVEYLIYIIHQVFLFVQNGSKHIKFPLVFSLKKKILCCSSDSIFHSWNPIISIFRFIAHLGFVTEGETLLFLIDC